ncbi:MAG: hypothetical protein WA930_05785 [Rhodanobacter sp.]
MKRVALLFAVVMLAGCSTTPVTRSASQPVPASQVLAPELQAPSASRTLPVLLIRDAGFMGSFVGAIVAVDGQNVVMLKPSQRFEFYLSAGNHMFSIKQEKNPLGEPMGETDIEIRPKGPNTFRLRLISGEGPRIERSTQINE